MWKPRWIMTEITPSADDRKAVKQKWHYAEENAAPPTHTRTHTHSILEQSDVQISSDKIPGSTLSEGHYKLKCVRMCETERHSPQSTVYPICLSLKLANGLFPWHTHTHTQPIHKYLSLTILNILFAILSIKRQGKEPKVDFFFLFFFNPLSFEMSIFV